MRLGVRGALQEKGNKIIVPPELKGKVMSQVMSMGDVREKRRKHLVLKSVLAAALFVPSSAFAYQTWMADGLYGSFQNVRKHVAFVTMDSYMKLNAKLLQAQGTLGEEEYDTFQSSLKVITNAKLEYGNQYGNINYDKLPAAKVTEIRRSLMEVQPYFDQLNGQISSKEVLSSAEYDQYIQALMTYESVLAQADIDTSKGQEELESLPEPLRTTFQQAQDFIRYVENKKQ